MTLKEAYKILGASKQDDDREIKAKYNKAIENFYADFCRKYDEFCKSTMFLH